MIFSTDSTLVASTSLAWLKIWRLIGIVVFYQLGTFSNVAIGVVNTSEACEVLDIKVPFDLC
jgi:hypothetical protein